MGGDVGKGGAAAAVREGAAARRALPMASESGTRPAAPKAQRVLLVEDEDMVRKVVSRMLVSRGFKVQSAASGAQAIALFDAVGPDAFDLLVTDLMMPDGGGLAVARELTRRAPELKVLFVSGYSSADLEDCEPAQHRFLTKPFGSAELARVIEELLSTRGAP